MNVWRFVGHVDRQGRSTCSRPFRGCEGTKWNGLVSLALLFVDWYGNSNTRPNGAPQTASVGLPRRVCAEGASGWKGSVEERKDDSVLQPSHRTELDRFSQSEREGEKVIVGGDSCPGRRKDG